MDEMNQEVIAEDHFSPDEVSAIKRCEDPRIHGYYKQYKQAEAMGDMARADMMAQLIKDRCELVGVTASAMPAEGCSEASPFESWESKMKKSGATHFEESVDERVSAYKVVEGKDLVVGEFDKVLGDEIFEDLAESEVYKKYTEAGSKNSYEIWKEYVVAEGATALKKKGALTVAYIGESRIGAFTAVKDVKKVKSFGEILSESAPAPATEKPQSALLTTSVDMSNIAHLRSLSGVRSLNEDVSKTEWSNSPDEKVADADTQLNKMAGGLNKPKKQINPNNPGDNPLTMKKPGKAGFLNLDEEELVESLITEFSNFSTTVDEATNGRVEPYHFQAGKPADAATLGHKAGRRGASAEKNPYEPGTPEAKEWSEGWKDGRDEMREKTRESASDEQAYSKSALGEYANKVVAENVETRGNIGDEVVVRGNIAFAGERGVIVDFGQGNRFVIVDLYYHGNASFHSSDVVLVDDDEEGDDDIYEGNVPGDEVWQAVMSALASGYPDLDPADSLAPVMRKYKIRDFSVFNKLAQKHGYSDVYAVADEFTSGSKIHESADDKDDQEEEDTDADDKPWDKKKSVNESVDFLKKMAGL